MLVSRDVSDIKTKTPVDWIEAVVDEGIVVFVPVDDLTDDLKDLDVAFYLTTKFLGVFDLEFKVEN